MNKNELAIAISEACKLSKKDAENVVNAMIDEMTKALKKGEEIKLAGFGAFAVKTRKERMGTIPGTGKKIKIPATKTIGFKASKTLKDLVK